jgi:hypothetical protein
LADDAKALPGVQNGRMFPLPTHLFTTPSFTLIILEVVAGQDRIDETARLVGLILDDY